MAAIQNKEFIQLFILVGGLLIIDKKPSCKVLLKYIQ